MVLRFDQKEITDNYHCPFELELCRHAKVARERNVIFWTYEGMLQCKALIRHAPKGTRCSYLEFLRTVLKRDLAKAPAKLKEETVLPFNTLKG